jgi:hypothetical protein
MAELAFDLGAVVFDFQLAFDPFRQTASMNILHGAQAFAGREHVADCLILEADAAFFRLSRSSRDEFYVDGVFGWVRGAAGCVGVGEMGVDLEGEGVWAIGEVFDVEVFWLLYHLIIKNILI